MQRHADPLIQAEAPLIGTAIEEVVAKDSGVTIVTKRDGVVEDVDASRIVVRCGDSVDIYILKKFKRSNQNTGINQKPIVRSGDRVSKGDVIADGHSTDRGELALGRNVLVAFMPWGGYNFEDSILINERLVKEDVFTSVHIEEFEVMARDIKLGKEEITRDIPNVGEDALKDLDESGIVRIGAERDERSKSIEDKEVAKLLKDRDDEIRIVKDNFHKKIKKLLLGKHLAAKLTDKKGNAILKKG